MLRLLLLTMLLAAIDADQDKEIVKTLEGLVRGSTMTSFTGRTFRAYQGIPYAEPPVGFLRFKSPQPKSPWNGVLNATAEGAICPQIVLATRQYDGDEDCLFLNVYAHENAQNYPVIVWVHGGGFIEGHGGVALTGPEYLLDHDIVLVTFNYRLGPLGFVSTGDSALSGNYGLKDCVELLRWVQRNIEVFGGNPGAVTVFGYSSGAANAHSLTLSPLSTGLFHRVIFESGSSLHHWAFKSSPISEARQLAKFVGCPSTDSSEGIAQCLSTAPVKKIVETLFNFPHWSVQIPLPYGIVAEAQNDNSDPAFLTESPWESMKKGSVLKIPALSGMTASEVVDLSYIVMQTGELLSEFDESFHKIVLKDFFPGNVTDEIVTNVKKFYFGGKSAKAATLQQLIDLYSDIVFNYNTYRAILAHSQATRLPVYVYKFSFEGRLSSVVVNNIHPTPLGVNHADDLFYIFGRGVDFPGGGPNAEEKRTIQRVTKMLADFALTGNPTPKTDDLISVKWVPFEGDKAEFRYLEIDKELKMHSASIFPERMAFWDFLFSRKQHDEL